MSTLRRKLTVACALLFALVLVSTAAIQFLLRSEGFRARIQSELSWRTGYDVRIDDLRLTPSLGLAASGVSVSRNGRALFQGKRIVCSFLPFDLFYNRVRRLSLEKPLLRLSLQDLFGPSEKKPPQFSIGSLNIDDGDFVLEKGDGEAFALRSVFLNAENVNLGGTTGLQLRAYLPALNGTAALSISRAAEGRQVEIRMDQAEEKPLRPLPQPATGKGALAARFQMKATGSETYEVKGSGSVDQLRWGDERITGEFNSLLELDARVKRLLFSVDLNTPRFPSKLLPMEVPLTPGAMKATLRGRYSLQEKTLTVQGMRLASSLAVLEGEGAVTLGEKASLAATLRLREVALDALKTLMPKPFNSYAYAGKISADMSLSGTYDDPFVTGLAWNDQAKVRGERVSLSQLALKIPFRWGRSAFQVKAGRIEGKDLIFGREGETQLKVEGATLVSDIMKERLKPLQMSMDFQLIEGRLSTPGGSRAGEHLNAKGRFIYQDRAGDTSFKGEARIERFELLWDKFFGDFKGEKPLIEVDGSYRRDVDEIRLDRFSVALSSVGHLSLKGWVRSLLADPAFGLEVRSDDLSHAGFYDFFVRDTFKTSYPVLGQIRVSGKSSLALRAEGSVKTFTLEGDLRLQQSEIQEKAGRWRIGPVALELPLKLRFPEAMKEKAPGAASAGKLSIREVRTASTVIPEISTPVVLWNNRLWFPEPVRIALFGGYGLVENLAWSDLIGAPRDLMFSLRLSDLSLLELTETLGWHRFGGTLSGSIPEVHWAGESLRSNGAITLNVFGGRVTIRSMEIERPLSSLQAIRMDAKLEGLDLEQASKTFEFGRISGVLAGTIEGLVIAQGQAAQFRTDLQTVERPGVSQRISVEALNKITVLSSGNDAGSIYGGLAGFFDSFRYSKLGFKATLKNDRLLLRGIESKGGVEYLVVGSWLPPTVNIISYTQEIGFSELLQRLERIQKTGDSAS